MTNEFDPSKPNPEVSGIDIAEGLQDLFEREHRFPAPRKPIGDRLMLEEPMCAYTYVINSIDTGHVRELTLDEKIKFKERSVNSEKTMERKRDKNLRSRMNFGTEFHVAVDFRFKGPEFSMVASKTDIEVGVANRTNLYRYLQQKGMVLIDDTGRDPYTGRSTTQDRGYLMLPREIPHREFFEFEDEIRKRYPFSHKEIDLARLYQEKQGLDQSPAEAFASDPRNMMMFVDMLSMDDRFAGLFETARQISKARSETPRATMDDGVLSPPSPPEAIDEDGFSYPYQLEAPDPNHATSNTPGNIANFNVEGIDFTEINKVLKRLDIKGFPHKK